MSRVAAYAVRRRDGTYARPPWGRPVAPSVADRGRNEPVEGSCEELRVRASWCWCPTGLGSPIVSVTSRAATSMSSPAEGHDYAQALERCLRDGRMPSLCAVRMVVSYRIFHVPFRQPGGDRIFVPIEFSHELLHGGAFVDTKRQPLVLVCGPTLVRVGMHLPQLVEGIGREWVSAARCAG